MGGEGRGAAELLADEGGQQAGQGVKVSGLAVDVLPGGGPEVLVDAVEADIGHGG